MRIYSHRCRGFGHGEASVRAMREAMHSDVQGIILDVWLTKDGKWVVPYGRHDPRVPYRLTKRKCSLLDRALALFSAFGTGKELLLSVQSQGGERDLVRLLQRHDVIDQTVVIAWKREIVERMHEIEPTIRLGFSYIGQESEGQDHFDAGFTVEKSWLQSLEGLPDVPLYSLQAYKLACSKQLVGWAHDRGMIVLAFIVNKRLALRLLQHVDGIITDAAREFL